MVASIPSWIWHTYVYVPALAPANDSFHVGRIAVCGSPIEAASRRVAMIPESDTVAGDVRCETPLPPSSSTSSGGPPLQLNAGGPKGLSTPPGASHIGWNSVPKSVGKVTVWGSFGDRGRKITLSPGWMSRLRGKNSSRATCPSGLDVPAVTVHVDDPLRLRTCVFRDARASA